MGFCSDYFTHSIATAHPVELFNKTFTDVICPILPSFDTHNASFNPFLNESHPFQLHLSLTQLANASSSTYNSLWSQTNTVPFWLLIIVVPLISIRSPTFFTKFNALGTLSVIYLFILVIWKVATWGVHMDFNSTDNHFRVPKSRETFIVMTGVCSLAFFIHNAIHSVMRNNAEPKNNVDIFVLGLFYDYLQARDLLIAYICVALTYLGIGVLFYIAFPFPKECIQDNFLNNFTSTDVLTCIGRMCLFLQILTVFPLLMYILRSQFMYFFFHRFYPSCVHVSALHFILMGVCVAFAVFIPRIGEISRISGSFCGLVYIFTLPALVKIQRMRYERKVRFWSMAIHVSLIIIGLLNFAGQFVFH